MKVTFAVGQLNQLKCYNVSVGSTCLSTRLSQGLSAFNGHSLYEKNEIF